MMSQFAAPISEQIWDMKYRHKSHDGTIYDQDVTDTWRRIARALAAVEKDPTAWETVFYEALDGFKFLPAGRITAGAGTGRNVTLQNCYVMGTIPDSMEGIFQSLKEAALTMQAGGGIGYDFSTLRPKGAHVKGVDADASGPLTFMDCWDAMCRTVMSAGSRRGAMMATMRCDHPDIEDFITAKHDARRLRMFNVSVLVTDDFMTAVKADETWPLVFDGKVYRTVRARDLWDKIMRATYDYAEPGVIFIDRINGRNPLNYCETIAATNPCVTGETEILTKSGWVEIQKAAGHRHGIWNGKEWSEVIVNQTGENQEIVTVHFSDGTSIDCTKNHKFILNDGSRVEAKDLSCGMKLEKAHWPVVHGGTDDARAYMQGFFQGDGWESNGRQYIGLYGEKKGLIENFNGYISAREYSISGGYEGTDTDQEKTYLNFGKGFFMPKGVVPMPYSVKSRLDWLAGLMDSDGCAYRSDNSVSVQITSKDRLFLTRVDLMLKTLGVYGWVSSMKDHWRLTISANSVKSLQNIGLVTHRLDLSSNSPNRDASRFVQVVGIEDNGVIADKVYCFTDYRRHAGAFNGVVTANCGEQPLPPYGACLLGSINLTRFVRDGDIDYSEIERIVKVAVRMMDNVIDVSLYPLPQQKESAQNKRRIGLGVTGLADMLAMVGVEYGSDDAVKITDDLCMMVADVAYRTSIDLAKEKGAFPLFDPKEYYADTVPWLADEIRTHGIRNALLTSIAPTGTISLYAGNVSSGIEPIFATAYTRKVLLPDGTHATEEVVDYAVSEYRARSNSKTLPEWFVTAQDLPPAAHVRMQAAAQKWVDSAISKTVNVPADISFEDFKDVYMLAYDLGCKGCTTYRPNDVTGSVLTVSDDATGADDTAQACVYDPATGERSCAG